MQHHRLLFIWTWVERPTSPSALLQTVGYPNPPVLLKRRAGAGGGGFSCQTHDPWAEETFWYFTLPLWILLILSSIPTAHRSKCHFHLTALQANLPRSNAIC